MTQEELNKVIENHKHWLKEDCEGWEDMKADLSGVNLQGVNLKIGIIDADLVSRKKKHRFPNLVCMKISGYYKEKGHKVKLLTNYKKSKPI